MFASRKPLAVVLAVVMMFALLVPAAMAAPEVVVDPTAITYPTTASPAYVNPAGPAALPAGLALPYTEKQGDNGLRVRYDLTIANTQVNDIFVAFRFLDQANVVQFEWDYVVASNAVVTGVNSLFSHTIYPTLADGWYSVQVCARDLNNPQPIPPTSPWACAKQTMAVLIDSADPGARLIKPVDDAVISGQQFLLVGKAWDPGFVGEDDTALQYGSIKSTKFEYCAFTNFQPANGWCGPNDASWITIAAGTPSVGVPRQYEAVWDTTKVPDDHGFVRFCATDLVNLTTCDVEDIFVSNSYTIPLRVGWNLISTPLILYDCYIDHIVPDQTLLYPPNSITKVIGANNMAGALSWVWWLPGDVSGGVDRFLSGHGYWVYANQPATLKFVGSWGSMAGTDGPYFPREYPVGAGWNLIGYTHWGDPTLAWPHWDETKLVGDYLGITLDQSMEALWRYDANSGTWVSMTWFDLMVKGAGYWLALSEGGTINP